MPAWYGNHRGHKPVLWRLFSCPMCVGLGGAQVALEPNKAGSDQVGT
jgi:hypothetical protein